MFHLFVVERVEGNKLIGTIEMEEFSVEVDDTDKQIMELAVEDGDNIIAVDENYNLLDADEVDELFPEMNNEELIGIFDEIEDDEE